MVEVKFVVKAVDIGQNCGQGHGVQVAAAEQGQRGAGQHGRPRLVRGRPRKYAKSYQVCQHAFQNQRRCH